MANGRLGKASVGSKQTTAVYTNSSGAEASVSVVAQATGGSQFHLRIDTSSSSLDDTTTLVSETYNERFLRYNITNSLLADPASAYAGRFQYFDTTTSTSNNINTQFEAYVASNTTTYSCKGDSGEQYNAQSIYPYDTWKSLQSSATYALLVGTVARDSVFWYDISAQVSDEIGYYERVLGSVTSGNSQGKGHSYYNCGMCFDPWETDFPYAVSVNQSGYMSATSFDGASPSTTYSYTNETSSSWIYNIGFTSFAQPASDYNYPNLRVSNRITLADPASASNDFALNVTGATAYASSSGNTRAVNLTQYPYMRVFKMAGSNRPGGQVLFFEYNPVDKLHYVCYFKASTSQYYLATIDREVALGAMTINSTTSLAAGGSNASQGFNDITSELSLTIASPFEFSINSSNSSRSSFIGTAASPLWALCFSRFLDNTASDTYYSTDLKTWKSSAAFYTPADYSAVVGDSTVASNSGTVTATRSNIVNLGADGILEYATDFSQYSQTGLVLSNGDRVLTYNSGANPVSIQVMGFEGV